MYGKIFESIYDGTLAEDWRALITFQQMIILCDSEGIVDMTPAAISRRTGIPIKYIKAGIDLLEQPDPCSRTPDDEGRRVVRLDEHRPWGWKIVNHQKYRDLNDYEKVRGQNRERQRRYREKLRSESEDGNVTNVTSRDSNAKSRHTNTDTNTDTDTKDNARSKRLDGALFNHEGFDRFWRAYPKKRSKGDAKKAWRNLRPDAELENRILSAVEAAKKTPEWTKDGGQFIPYPATWLRREGWEDDYRLLSTGQNVHRGAI